jgi:hypothetical protein|tara:strand:- start:683 stop:901 length:219 start_codon:yes stop_codon:yes gene_type:complete
MNSKEFSMLIEDLVKKHKDMSYMDAIVHYCEQNNIEIESAAKMLTKQLKEKIQYQAQNLRLIKGPKPGVLPG